MIECTHAAGNVLHNVSVNADFYVYATFLYGLVCRTRYTLIEKSALSYTCTCHTVITHIQKRGIRIHVGLCGYVSIPYVGYLSCTQSLNHHKHNIKQTTTRNVPIPHLFTMCIQIIHIIHTIHCHRDKSALYVRGLTYLHD